MLRAMYSADRCWCTDLRGIERASDPPASAADGNGHGGAGHAVEHLDGEGDLAQLSGLNRAGFAGGVTPIFHPVATRDRCVLVLPPSLVRLLRDLSGWFSLVGKGPRGQVAQG